MNHDISFLADAWSSIKPYVSTKERTHAAEALIKLFDDYTDLSDIADHLDEFDKVMRNCLIDYYELFDEDHDTHDEDA
jgi:hypothetical protein